MVSFCQSRSDNPGEFGEIVTVMVGDITKAHGLFQLYRQVLMDDTGLGQGIEGFTHGVRWRHFHASNQVCADIHTQLHGPGKVDRDNILKIGVSPQRFWVGRTFVRDALILVFARSLPDPCLSPFGEDSVAIWQEIRLFEEVPTNEVSVVCIAAQNSFSMTKDLPQKWLASGVNIH